MAEDRPPPEMEPPWVVEPKGWTGIEWITRKSEYRQAWRGWFLSLSKDEQARYIARYRPPPDADVFYEFFGRPDWSPEREAEKWRDDEGYLAPPWIAFPIIPRGSIGWRMGAGEDYWGVFVDWFRGLSEGEGVQFRSKYPEPDKAASEFPWTGFYEQLESNNG